MRKYSKAIFFFSLLIFLFAGYSSVIAAHQINSSTTHVQSASFSREVVSNNPVTPIHYSIRHRSPHQVESITVPMPNEEQLFTNDFLESTPEYFSKWSTYFHFEFEKLPDDQVFPPATSLRAPPFSC